MTAEELQHEIDVAQPDLTVCARSGGFEVRGMFRLSDSDGLLEEFAIEVFVPANFPVDAPRVWEIGGRIPRTANRHVNPADGSLCCFTVEDYLVWKLKEGGLSAYFDGPLRNYFLSQVSFTDTGKWPFGERPHGLVGRLDFYKDLFGLPTFDGVLGNLEKLQRGRFKGHYCCPCGSGAIIRQCHPDVILVQRHFPNSALQGAVDVFRKMEDQIRRDNSAKRVIAKALADGSRKN